jgi:hypothetical protein
VGGASDGGGVLGGGAIDAVDMRVMYILYTHAIFFNQTKGSF